MEHFKSIIWDSLLNTLAAESVITDFWEWKGESLPL